MPYSNATQRCVLERKEIKSLGLNCPIFLKSGKGLQPISFPVIETAITSLPINSSHVKGEYEYFFLPSSPVSRKIISSNLLACEHPASCTPPNFSYSWWTFLQFYQQYIQFHVAQFSQMWLAWLWFILCTKALAKLLVVFFHILFIIIFPLFFFLGGGIFINTPHSHKYCCYLLLRAYVSIWYIQCYCSYFLIVLLQQSRE